MMLAKSAEYAQHAQRLYHRPRRHATLAGREDERHTWRARVAALERARRRRDAHRICGTPTRCRCRCCAMPGHTCQRRLPSRRAHDAAEPPLHGRRLRHDDVAPYARRAPAMPNEMPNEKMSWRAPMRAHTGKHGHCRDDETAAPAIDGARIYDIFSAIAVIFLCFTRRRLCGHIRAARGHGA